jgi:hypothetical protein
MTAPHDPRLVITDDVQINDLQLGRWRQLDMFHGAVSQQEFPNVSQGAQFQHL